MCPAATPKKGSAARDLEAPSSVKMAKSVGGDPPDFGVWLETVDSANVDKALYHQGCGGPRLGSYLA